MRCKQMLSLSVVTVLLAASLAGCGTSSTAPSAVSSEAPSSAASSAASEVTETAALPDGVYTAEFDTDSGMFHANEACDGKGTLTVKDGKVTAKIVWSSKNYDYMKVGDTKYDTVIEDEHSTFEIPVSCFDWAMAVKADTTAMSEAHEIDYTLTFDASSAEVNR